MEERPDSPVVVKAEDKSTSVLFTYFQGDINSVVDEHFSRALKKASKPKDLSARSKGNSRIPRSEEPASVPWGFPSSSWLEPTFPSTSSGQIQFSTPLGPQLPQRAMTGPGSPSSGLWSFAPRPGTSFGLSPMMYSSPASTEGPGPGPGERQYTNSFLGLLHSDRPVGSSGLNTSSKADLNPGWNAHTGFRDPLGPGISLDSGLPGPERKKDLYWY